MVTEPEGKNMSSAKWLAVMLLGMIAAACVTWLSMRPAMEAANKQTNGTQHTEAIVQNNSLPCDDVSITRDNSPSLTKPFLFADVQCESDALQSLKAELTEIIDARKKEGIISRASVYYKELNTLHWTSAYGDELYYPGSMLKIPLLLTILKQAQRDRALLESKIQFNSPTKLGVMVPVQNPLVVGNFYTVQQLLEQMILQSDNDATSLLFSIYDRRFYDDLFMKLSIPLQDPEDAYYQLSGKDIAKFLRVLYNASYLSSLYSEYALDLLTKSSFKQGVLQGLPAGTKVAHKFGERFTTSDLVQLHETAIVYRGSAAFVVTIMTEGKNMNNLSEVIGTLSKVCFNEKTAESKKADSAVHKV
jgi:beta-lactamase class A